MIYRDRMEQLKRACKNVELICAGGAESLIPIAKMTVEQIVDKRIKKASFVYGGTTIRLQRGKDEIKVEKIVTVKESLES